jgi:hypothetical protein
MPIALTDFGRALAAALLGTCCLAAEATRIEVRETAGIQRFGYPLAAEFHASAATQPESFRLLDGGRELAAQFTRLAQAEGAASALWSVDFSIDLSPGETRTLTIDELAQFSPPIKKSSGIQVERTEHEIRIRHPSLEFRVADNLDGLIQAIQVRGDDYLVAGSPGLVVQLRDGRKLNFLGHSLGRGSSPAIVIKSGPLAAALQFHDRLKLAVGEELRSTVDLDFPLGKSWVRVNCQVIDPNDIVAAIGSELRLRLEPKENPPVLADVGAAGWTYATLGPEDRLIFRAGPRGEPKRDSTQPAWQVDRTLSGRFAPFVRPALVGADIPPQGWGHLMDAKRATAIAVDQFAEKSDDTIELGGQGHVRMQRVFGQQPRGAPLAVKRLTFWLHVVSSPPQRGAATSPQSMMLPPRVRVIEATDES